MYEIPHKPVICAVVPAGMAVYYFGGSFVGRAAVLIDLGYFGKVLKFCFGEPRINYEKFSDVICEGRERLRTYIYDCMPYQSSPPTSEERDRFGAHDRFMSMLKRLNRFEVRLGKIFKNPRTGEFYQKRVDVLFSVDLVRMSWDSQIDTAVIVTGDSDLVPAIQAAKDAGVLTILYYRDCKDESGKWVARAHDELRDGCDERRLLDETLIDSVLLDNK